MSSSSNPPPVGTPKSTAPSGGKGKDFARMSAAAAAAAVASSTTPVAAPAPPTAESPSPVKKGKDLSRMVASAPPSATSFVASQDIPPSDVTPVGKPKGKDLSRMGSVQRTSPASAVGQGVAVAAAGNPGMPSVGVSLGKDLANMPRPPTLQSPTLHTNAPTTTQVKSLAPAPTNLSTAADIAEHQRRQSIARAAAGLDAVKPPIAGTDLHPIQAPTKNVSPENQPTPRPSWSEATLSAASSLHGTNNATDTSSKAAAATANAGTATTTTTKKYGDPTLAPILGTKLQNLCRSIDPSYVLDAQVQESLLEMADSFLDKVTSDAIRLARHRGSKTLDVVDVALALKKGYGMEVPGLGAPSHPQSGVGAGASGRKNHMIGGWLFANKLNATSEGEKRGRKKQKKV